MKVSTRILKYIPNRNAYHSGRISPLTGTARIITNTASGAKSIFISEAKKHLMDSLMYFPVVPSDTHAYQRFQEIPCNSAVDGISQQHQTNDTNPLLWNC
ncbi:MAG: hypothetical protein ACNA7I_05230 [Candidatus Methanoperedens sp.]